MPPTVRVTGPGRKKSGNRLPSIATIVDSSPLGTDRRRGSAGCRCAETAGDRSAVVGLIAPLRLAEWPARTAEASRAHSRITG